MWDEHIRELLVQWADRIDRQIQVLEEDMASRSESIPSDLDLLLRLRSERDDVAMAFSRLAAGDYRVCDECGESVSDQCFTATGGGLLCPRHRLVTH